MPSRWAPRRRSYPGVHTGADVSETFSSDGPARTFYAPDGTPVGGGATSAGGVPRDGVDLMAADGTSTTTPMFPTFYGTSAAAPNAASLAVLALAADPTLTPDEVERALTASAVDVEAPGPDPVAGAGIPLAPALMAEVGLGEAALVQPGERTVTELIGDGDDVYEPGEVFEVEQALENRGGAPATDVAATLTSTSSSVAVTASSSTYGTLAAGEAGAPSRVFKVRILKTCRCGAELPFRLTTTYGGGLEPSRTATFGLTVGTAGPGTTAVRSGAPLDIPDLPATGAPTTVATSIEVGDIGGPIRDLAVTFGGTTCTSTAGATTVGVTHSFVGDLEMTLVSPAGTAVALTTRTTNSGNNLCRTTFADDATASFRNAPAKAAPYTGSYRPASPLSAFDGEDARGTWTLRIADARRGDVGTLRDVALALTPASCDLLAGPSPTAAADQLATPYQTPLTVEDPGVLANDTDVYGDGLEASLVDDVEHGTLELDEDGTLAYVPDPGFSGTDTFRYVAHDADTSSAPAVVTIDVGPAPNTAPTAGDDAYRTSYGTPLRVETPGVLGNDEDAEHDAATAAVVHDVAHGELVLEGNGAFTYTPDAGFSGTDAFTYRAHDGELASDAATVVLTVDAEPDTAPVAGDDGYATGHGEALRVAAPGVLADDADRQGQALTVGLVDDVQHGDLDLAVDGGFTYTPDEGFSGDDTFTYVASDGWLTSEPATVTITVAEPPGPAPIAVDDAYSTPLRTAHAAPAPGLLLNDAEDATGVIAELVAPPTGGSVVVRPDGSFTYQPDPAFRGDDAFTYRIRVAGRWSPPATATVTVGRPTGAAPVARADAYDAVAAQRLVVRKPGVLADDVDPDGDALTVVVDQDVAHGTLALARDGSFLYTPDAGFRGVDRFTYVARDGRFVSPAAVVELHVTSPHDAFVDAVSRQFRGRPATAAEIAEWGTAIESRAQTRASFVRDVALGAEHLAIVVRRTYRAYVGHPATPEDEARWVAELQGGLPVAELPIRILGTPDFVAHSADEPSTVVDALFASILHREPTAAERTKWANTLARGGTRDSVARTLYTSPEAGRLRIAEQFELVLGRAPTASEVSTWLARFANKDERDLAIALAASDEYLAATAP
jgi:subtilisin-like proprotein convertase family protein